MKPNPVSDLKTCVQSSVLIAANPAAGRGATASLVEALVTSLRATGLKPVCTNSLDDLAGDFSEHFATGNLRAVLAVGGDGTAAAVANTTEGRVPIVVVPMGTENLLARRLGMSNDVPRIVETIRYGRIQSIDAGRVNGRMFLIMFSCGFDAEVVRRLHERRRGPITHWSYARPIFSALRAYRFPPITIRFNSENDQSIVLDGHWLFAFNFSCYARGLPIAPRACPTDGLFDVCILRSPSRMTSFFHFLTVATRCQGEWSGFRSIQCSSLRVESREPVPYQVDGDMAGYLPVDLTLLPQQISVVVPAE